MIIYSEDKEAIKKLEKTLGEADASYFDTWENGTLVGAHWFISQALAKKLQKRFGNKVETLK